MITAVLTYATLGYSLVPVMPGTKRPAVRWGELRRRGPTEADIRRWWRQWPGT